MKNLTLYYIPTCPFCEKVLRHLEELGKEIPLKNIRSHPELKQELIDIGGKKQVPCLVIDGEPLYESDAIVLWIEEHPHCIPDLPPNKRM